MSTVPPQDAPPSATPFAQPIRSRGGAGFSLASLFVLTTVCAVLVAGVAPTMQLLATGKISFFDLGGVTIVGCFCGSVLGLILGMHWFDRFRGAFIGGGIGAALGTVAGPLTLLPQNLVPPIALAMFIGSLLLVGIALALRPSRSR